MVLTLEDFEKHVTGKLVPYVVSQYNITTKVMATLDQLFSDLISAVGKTNAQEIFTFGFEECTDYVNVT